MPPVFAGVGGIGVKSNFLTAIRSVIYNAWLALDAGHGTDLS